MSKKIPEVWNTSALDGSTSSSRRSILVAKGNVAFVRLLTLVLDQIEGFSYQILAADDLVKAAINVRPDIIMVIEDAPTYNHLKSFSALRDIPFLFITISDLDKKNLPLLSEGDQSWILKNYPLELAGIVVGMKRDPRVKQILCVDDSPTVLKQLKKGFAGTPYAITTAENGQEALTILDGLIPDLILTDIEMPVMDGLAFCRAVRQRKQTADVPLIILSSRVDHETIQLGFEAGADEYLTKPFFPDEVINKVETYLIPIPTRRKEHILVVSPVASVNHQLRLALANQGFEVTIQTTSTEAIDTLGEDPDLIISDNDLSDMTGFQFCAEIRGRQRLRRVPLVILTGKTSSGARKMGEKVGVTAYLTKPFSREGVITLVERLLAEQRSLRALEWDMVLASITSLAKALDERDPYTRFHSENVARYAMAIGRKAGMNVQEIENIRLAGLLHDIGKIGVPDEVLHKPDRLTDEEFEKIKRHSQLGAEILKPLPTLEEVIPGILHHHERLDGSGYPHSLAGNQIPILAQILAVADTFDALVTDRPYRYGLPKDKAVAIMKEVAGTQLSPKYVRLFLEWLTFSENEPF